MKMKSKRKKKYIKLNEIIKPFCRLKTYNQTTKRNPFSVLNLGSFIQLNNSKKNFPSISTLTHIHKDIVIQ